MHSDIAPTFTHANTRRRPIAIIALYGRSIRIHCGATRVFLNPNPYGVSSECSTPSTSFFCLLNRLAMADLQPDESNDSGSLKPPTVSPTPRGKRKRYTPVACDECKKRKGKCDSQIPCQRCRDRVVTCTYNSRLATMPLQKERHVLSSAHCLHYTVCTCLTSFRDLDALNEKIEKMQEQIDRLIADRLPSGSSGKHQSTVSTTASISPSQGLNTTDLTDQSDHNGALVNSSATSHARLPEFLGPTSSSFLFRMATDSLASAGIHTPVCTKLEVEPLPTSAKVKRQDTSSANRGMENPLCTIPRNEALRLLQVYDEEYGSIYPFIDKTVLHRAAQCFYDCVDMASPSSTKTYQKDENTLSDGIWDILKLVIAIAATIESHGPNELSAKLLNSVESGFDIRVLGEKVELLEIQAWTAMSILQFHLDEEVLAWRTIGLAGRAAIELGLHRRETYSIRFSDDEQRLRASQLFWSIYILDRRWSFSTGRSFAIPECDVDLDLPKLSSSDSYLLSIMVAYAQLESKQWYRSLKPQYQLQPTEANMLHGYTRSENRIRLLFYFNVNQLQLFIFRQELLNSHAMNEDLLNATFAVEAAKDNIRLLQKVSQMADFYSTQQAPFNHFLVSALAVLFLAVCHAPYQFKNACREEFIMALELIQGFSFESHVGKRLWKRVQHLKEISLSLGLLPNKTQTDGFVSMEQDQHVQTRQPPVHSQMGPPSANEMIDPYQLTSDLTTMFDTMQQPYRWPAADEVVLDQVDKYHQTMNRELSRDLLDLF
ncbi:hypothetical protein COCVIDRAFT_15163 [Bipolaris victoriae FI3]|uniref:Zn(2)-C6 fungal-type domain-containing protein n=1 Tax=Bipolaris victoriae (strain FI3) TaxID=930091 RepID=W7EIY8_BIPV3|nr:hypothetical protein COCVIDRAFT_15163 [Bipolaris victoriae FI3]